jgi:A/G-specific adenine glycosylase
MRKRTGEDIWKNLYDFPIIEAERELSQEEISHTQAWGKIAGNYNLQIVSEKKLSPYLLSHRELRVKFFILKSSDYFHREFIKVPFSEVCNYPVPRLIEKILKIVT